MTNKNSENHRKFFDLPPYMQVIDTMMRYIQTVCYGLPSLYILVPPMLLSNELYNSSTVEYLDNIAHLFVNINFDDGETSPGNYYFDVGVGNLTDSTNMIRKNIIVPRKFYGECFKHEKIISFSNIFIAINQSRNFVLKLLSYSQWKSVSLTTMDFEEAFSMTTTSLASAPSTATLWRWLLPRI